MSPFNIPTTYINFKWLLPDIQNIFSFQQDVTIQLQYITSSSWLIFPTLKCMTVWCPVLGSRSIQTDEGRKDRMRRSVPKVAQAGTCPTCPTRGLCPPSLCPPSQAGTCPTRGLCPPSLRTARGRCPMFPLSFKMSTSPILSKVGGVFSYLFICYKVQVSSQKSKLCSHSKTYLRMRGCQINQSPTQISCVLWSGHSSYLSQPAVVFFFSTENVKPTTLFRE